MQTEYAGHSVTSSDQVREMKNRKTNHPKNGTCSTHAKRQTNEDSSPWMAP